MTERNPFAGVGSRTRAPKNEGRASGPLPTARPPLVPVAAQLDHIDVDPLDPRDDALTPPHWEPSPEWAQEYRPHQWAAATEVCEAFANGIKVVFVDAPTGAGKTLLGDLISRMMAQPAIYLCTTKGLQQQIVEDFKYASVLKGRANYTPMFKPPMSDVSCEDCTGTSIVANNCKFCDPMHACPYRKAKADAIRSQLAVLNMAYWLREANLVEKPAFSLPPDNAIPRGATTRRRREGGLFIIDECDTLEDQLLSYVEFQVGKRLLKELQIEAPKKGLHKKTLAKWMLDELVPALDGVAKGYIGRGVELERRARRLGAMSESAVTVAAQIEDENWMRDYEREDAVPFSMKPVKVDTFGNDLLWRHGGRFVLMSATIISPEEMARSLGLEDEYATVRVPATFAAANRPVHVTPVANLTYKTEPEEWPKAARAVRRILEWHPDVNVLIHAVSYKRAQKLMGELREERQSREFFTYTNARDREEAIELFKESRGGVMIAPSLERGVDLKDDECRVQVVLKMPYPNISDPRVNARAHGPDGEGWMAVQTIRALVQMTGRAVRSEDDWAETYILDSQFTSRILRRNRDLLPAWWRESLNLRFRVRDLVRD